MPHTKKIKKESLVGSELDIFLTTEIGIFSWFDGKRIRFNPRPFSTKMFDENVLERKQSEVDEEGIVDFHLEIVKKIDALIAEHEKEIELEERLGSIPSGDLEEVVEMREPLRKEPETPGFKLEDRNESVFDERGADDGLFEIESTPREVDSDFSFVTSPKVPEDAKHDDEVESKHIKNRSWLSLMLGGQDKESQSSATGFAHIKVRSKEERSKLKTIRGKNKQSEKKASPSQMMENKAEEEKTEENNDVAKTEKELEETRRKIEQKKEELERAKMKAEEKEEELKRKEKEKEKREKDLQRLKKIEEKLSYIPVDLEERLKELKDKEREEELNRIEREAEEKERELKRKEKERLEREKEREKLKKMELKKKEKEAKLREKEKIKREGEQERLKKLELKKKEKEAKLREKKLKQKAREEEIRKKKLEAEKAIEEEELRRRKLKEAKKAEKEKVTKPVRKDVVALKTKEEDSASKPQRFIFGKKKEVVEEEEVAEEDIQRVLVMVDDLLGELPEEVIEEFVQSKDYKLYEKVISKYKK